MNCEIGIHEAFIELKQIICPFCKQPLEDEKKRDNTDEYYFCCDRREIGWLSIGLPCGRSRVQTPAEPPLRVFK